MKPWWLFFLCLVGSTALAAAAAPIAFLGLRPAQDKALGETAISQLAEAQRLRQTLESVVEALSGTPVLGHEPLRASVGRGYLVGLFECKGEPFCQLKLASTLRATGVTVALSGDYFADETSLHVRLRRLDLVRERLADEATFSLPRSDSGSLAAWRAALAPLFADTGSLTLVVSQPDSQCTLDGRRCELDTAGTVREVAEGEHLLVLSKEGFKHAERVVAIRRGEQTRVAVVLEEQPVNVQKAPDPAARLPTFSEPTEQAQVKPFGSVRLAFLVDDANAGERDDAVVPAGLSPSGLGLVVLPKPAVLGVTIQAPRQASGWQTRGALSVAWVRDVVPEVDSAFAEVVKEDLGFRVMAGWGPGIISSLTAGTLTLPEGFGDLSFGGVGVTVSQSFGPILAEAFLGKHKSQFSPQVAVGTVSPTPMGALHLAYVSSEYSGVLYGDEYPLTVGVSALVGEERMGLGDEAAWAETVGVAPLEEQLPVWVASLEVYVPFGKKVSLSGEAFLGDDVRLLEGAAWQPPRVDPETGRHRALRSVGGWAQVAVNVTEDLELRALAGTDQALAFLEQGLPVGDEPAIRSNRLAAVNGVWRYGQLSFGLQLHTVRTDYADPKDGVATLLGGALTSQLEF